MLYAAVKQGLAGAGVALAGAERVLVACSGGADSVALAQVCVRLLGPQRVTLGHVDHAVWAGSGAAAAAVATLAAGLGAGSRAARLPPGPADEARLREARYAALERLRAEADAALILTAHTADDQAETVLLQLLRSTHAGCLAGMPRQRGNILRPLLSVPRAAVRAYVQRHRLPVVEDPSNLEVAYLRNRVRKELLPLIELRYRPGLARRLARLSQTLTSTPAPVPPGAPTSPSRGPTRASPTGPGPTSPGAATPTPPASPGAPASPSPSPGAPASTSPLMAGPTSAGLPGGAGRGGRDRSPVGAGDRAGGGAGDPPAEARGFVWRPPGVELARRPHRVGEPPPDGAQAAYFDAAVLRRPQLRAVRAGDRMRPFGMTGHRKLRDLLREGGVPAEARARYPVLVDGDSGAVVWLPGLRRADFAPVTGSTAELWVFHVS